MNLRERMRLTIWWFTYGPLGWSEAWGLSGVYGEVLDGNVAPKGDA